jgi:hypothetical protein
MFKFAINLIGFALVAIGAIQGVNVIANIQTAMPTNEPLAFALAGCFLLMITNIKGA